MKLDDLETSVYKGLTQLTIDVYTWIMYGISQQLAIMYDDELDSSARALVRETHEALFSVIRRSGSPDPARVAVLLPNWNRTIDESDGRRPGGVLSYFRTLSALVAEVNGVGSPYRAVEWVTQAFRLHGEPLSLDPGDPDYAVKFQRYVWLNSPLEADESEYFVRLLRAIEAAVERAKTGDLPDDGPEHARAAIFAGIE